MRLAEIFGRRAREARERRHMTLEQLAHRARLDVSYTGQIERGTRNPTLDVVERFSAALGLTPRDLLQPYDDEPPRE